MGFGRVVFVAAGVDFRRNRRGKLIGLRRFDTGPVGPPRWWIDVKSGPSGREISAMLAHGARDSRAAAGPQITAFSSASSQHFMYLRPLPQRHGSLRSGRSLAT